MDTTADIVSKADFVSLQIRLVERADGTIDLFTNSEIFERRSKNVGN